MFQRRFPQAVLHNLVYLPKGGPGVGIAVVGGPARQLSVDGINQVLLGAPVGGNQLPQRRLFLFNCALARCYINVPVLLYVGAGYEVHPLADGDNLCLFL